FAGLDLIGFQQSTTDNIFFNPVGSIFIACSENLVLPQQIAVTFLVVFATTLAFRELRGRKLLLALLPGLFLFILVPLTLGGTWWLLSYIIKGSLIVADSPSNAFLLIGLIIEGCVVCCLAYTFFAKRFSYRELTFGALILL